jgi:hypothetical protein
MRQKLEKKPALRHKKSLPVGIIKIGYKISKVNFIYPHSPAMAKSMLNFVSFYKIRLFQ